MDKKDKRILWLINHTTLREFEAPLLTALGYELYTPKCIPDLIYEWSGSIDYSYDHTLTIPKDELDILNQHDFYEGTLTQPILSIINKYFGAVFVVFYPKMLEQVVKGFEGRILLRAFGLDKSTSYGKIIDDALGRHFLSRLQAIGERFWFSEAYPNLHEIEPHALKSRSVYHPLGLPDKFFTHRNTWTGGVNKILFFCSRIKASPTYYGKIYESFKKHFGDIPHLIAGNQPIAVDDPCVAGHQPREKIDEWLRTYNVMFYHSEEPRHLHYHPLEAIVYGMPLIYMREGVLGITNKDQPGACTSFKEAREKITRILDGDQAFIKEICRRQVEMLEPFTWEYNLRTWEKNFVSKIMTTPVISKLNNAVKTIGVFLPVGYKGGSLTGAKNIAKMIHLGSRNTNEPINVVFSCIDNHYNIAEDFEDLIELGIPVRETHWSIISRNEAARAQGFTNQRYPLHHPAYVMPNSGIGNFNECDFWLLISDRVNQPLAPIKPYGMIVYDYIQRYVPEIFSTGFSDHSFLATARAADFVITTTPQTKEDAIQYAGVPAHRVHVAPMEFNPLICSFEPNANNENYFMWTTNPTPHKNHLRAIEALDIYYGELGGKFDVVMSGSESEFFRMDQHCTHIKYTTHVKKVRALLEEKPNVRKHLHVMGNLPLSDYVSRLASAKFLWHPTTIDNGTYAVIEAAYYGVPSLSSDYPQMRFMDERFKLNLNFCQSSQARDMAVNLKKMETEHYALCDALPSREFLGQFSFTELAPKFWSLIRSLI